MLIALLVSCSMGEDAESDPLCREQTILVSSWMDTAAEAECAYFSRCLDLQYPGYGASSECVPEALESHVAYTEDGTKCVDPCLAEEFLIAYLEEPCVEGESAKPAAYSFAYTDCVLTQGL
jgi:hypothetical protein